MKPPSAASLPWFPPPYDIADVVAVKAVAQGTGSPEQQKRAWHWLIYRACATYDSEFRPGGEDGRRASDFAAGRRFVGLELVKLITLAPQALEAMRAAAARDATEPQAPRQSQVRRPTVRRGTLRKEPQ